MKRVFHCKQNRKYLWLFLSNSIQPEKLLRFFLHKATYIVSSEAIDTDD